jgi:L-amino acid N-acyltransferase YncA
MNVSLRLATNGDCSRIAKIHARYVVNTAISFENEPPSPEEMEQRVQNTLDLLPWLVC